jgi:hypothetical protein
MTTSRALGVILTATLFACDSGKSTDTGDEADDTVGDTSESDSDSDSDSTETSTGGPEDSEGPPTPADFQALCEQQTDRAACEAVPGEHYPWEDQTTWCAWWVEVPVELVDDACSFGQTQARCVMNSASEAGCGVIGNACQSTDAGWSRVEGESVVIGRGNLCGDEDDPCVVDAQGVVSQGAPECACLCDPAFPL